MESARTILLVEDNPMVRDVTSLMLERGGHKVVTANGGPEALAILALLPVVDLMVTDVMMPVMTGFDLAFHARQILPSLKVLFVSGYHAENMPRDATVNSCDILQKPYRASVLLREVDRLLAETV